MLPSMVLLGAAMGRISMATRHELLAALVGRYAAAMAAPGRDGKAGPAVEQESRGLSSPEAAYMAQSAPDILMVSREHPGEATPRPLGSISE